MKNLLTEIKDHTYIITLNRPDKMNALNLQTIEELDSAIDQALAHTDVKGILLTGAGEKAFVAGADIAEFADYDATQGAEMAARGHVVFNKLERSPKPVIACINGFALGGGCELAMACHIRIAASHAKLGQPEVNLGIIPGYGGTQRLVHLVGRGKALELLMTADMIGAEEALRLGWVNHVVEPSELIDKAQSILQKIYTKAPLAIAKVIACTNALLDSGIQGMEYEINAFGECFATEDLREGTAAFVEKRKATFKGV